MNIAEVLTRLDISYSESGNEAIALCPMHEQRTGKQDSKPSFSVNLTTGAFQCFSCGYRGHIYWLVRDVVGLPGLNEARAWVGGTAQPIEQLLPDMKKRLIRRAPKNLRITRIQEDVPDLEGHYRSFYEVPVDLASSRGLTVETCRTFGLRVSGMNWIIPIRTPEGTLVGWQEKGPSRFRNHPVGVRKGSTLFGLNIVTGDQVVLVESPLDAALAHQAGFAAVASYGASVSDKQRRLLSDFYPILALDNDAAGQDAQRKLSAALTRDGVRHRIVLWPDGIKDFGDDPQAIPELVEKAVDPLKARMR